MGGGGFLTLGSGPPRAGAARPRPAPGATRVSDRCHHTGVCIGEWDLPAAAAPI